MAPRQLQVSALNPGHLRSHAREFTEAARLCVPQPKLTGIIPLGGPGTVLAAFALELWFKALYCKANPLGIAPTGHDLRRLFDSLEPIQKGAIGSKSGHSLADICSELQANADVFQTWRYAYEHGAGQPGPVQALEANIGLLFDLLKACEEVYALP